MPSRVPVPEEVLDLPDGASWAEWLQTHHDDASEARLRIAKQHSGLASISIADALGGAHCFGWIDGQRRSLDEVSFLQRYCPRPPRSTWSQINVDKVERLTAAGRMRPSGLAALAAAQADGRWAAAYESQRTAEVRATWPPPWPRTPPPPRSSSGSAVASATP